jgi:L-asparaginase
MPVVLSVRPERGAMLASTYGFHGAEGDLRASGAIPAGSLSPQAARMKLLACLGTGLDGGDLALAFSQDDP